MVLIIAWSGFGWFWVFWRGVGWFLSFRELREVKITWTSPGRSPMSNTLFLAEGNVHPASQLPGIDLDKASCEKEYPSCVSRVFLLIIYPNCSICLGRMLAYLTSVEASARCALEFCCCCLLQ